MELSFRAVSYLAAACAVSGLTVVAACSDSSTGTGTGATSTSSSGGSPEAGASDTGIADTGADSGPDPLAGCTKDPGATPPTFNANSSTDPTGGAANFTLDMALAGFPSGSGTLTAAISTEYSSIKCTLDETAAPITVANFVGLARGTRPYILTSQWQVGHFYDGLTFHRVIPDFVIQGGDPAGDGTGGPGYDLVTENQVAEPLGTLAMAASNTVSGSQFYIVVGTGPMPQYNVFGSCTTDNAITIANVPRDMNDDKPLTPVHMLKVEIARCP